MPSLVVLIFHENQLVPTCMAILFYDLPFYLNSQVIPLPAKGSFWNFFLLICVCTERDVFF